MRGLVMIASSIPAMIKIIIRWSLAVLLAFMGLSAAVWLVIQAGPLLGYLSSFFGVRETLLIGFMELSAAVLGGALFILGGRLALRGAGSRDLFILWSLALLAGGWGWLLEVVPTTNFLLALASSACCVWLLGDKRAAEPLSLPEGDLFAGNFPTIVPYVTAAWAAIFVAVLGFTLFFGERLIGRPSSTHGIGVIFVLLGATAAGIYGLGVGLILRLLLCRWISPRLISRQGRRILSGLSAAVIVVAFSSGAALAFFQEQAQRPRVLVNEGAFVRAAGASAEGMFFEAQALEPISRQWGEPPQESPAGAPFVWNYIELSAVLRDRNVLELRDPEGQVRLSADLGRFDYVSSLSAVTFGADAAASGLALLVNLRATAQRSILLIFDGQGRLLYQELLHRRGVVGRMTRIRQVAGQEYLALDLGETAFLIKLS